MFIKIDDEIIIDLREVKVIQKTKKDETQSEIVFVFKQNAEQLKCCLENLVAEKLWKSISALLKLYD